MDVAQVPWKARRLTALFRTASVEKSFHKNPIFPV